MHAEQNLRVFKRHAHRRYLWDAIVRDEPPWTIDAPAEYILAEHLFEHFETVQDVLRRGRARYYNSERKQAGNAVRVEEIDRVVIFAFVLPPLDGIEENDVDFYIIVDPTEYRRTNAEK